MRLFAFLLFVSFAAAQQPQQQQPQEPPKKASIEGSVVSTAGEPIPRAQIRLQGQASLQNGQIAQPRYTATASDDGKFVIENIDPGRNYTLTVQRPGFLPARYGARSATSPGAPISLDAGQAFRGITVQMTPQAVVSGRVTDQSGDPIQNAEVMLLRRGYQKGVRQFVLANIGISNDQGEFRIANVSPGRYILSVTERILGITRSAAQNANVTTYYPNATDQQGAATIDVTLGSDVRAIDIRMRQARVFAVRGKILDATGAPAANVAGLALPRGLDMNVSTLELSLMLNSTRMQSRQDGSFEMRGLQPGSYTLQTIPTNGLSGTSIGMGRADITITDSDVEGVTVQLAPGIVIQGSVKLEGGDIQTLLPPMNAADALRATSLAISASNAGIPMSGSRIAVALTSNLNSGNASGAVKDDATFTVENILPAGYYLNVAGLPPGHYVKSARFGGADVTTQMVDTTSGSGGNLEIVISNKAADVNGVVSPAKDEPVAGAMITLWSKDPDPGNQNNGVRTAYADQSGGFQFQNLRPGIYYVAAWQDIDTGLAQARDFLNQFTGEAVRLELGEGTHSAAQVKLIQADKIKAAEEKLP